MLCKVTSCCRLTGMGLNMSGGRSYRSTDLRNTKFFIKYRFNKFGKKIHKIFYECCNKCVYIYLNVNISYI